MDSGLPNGVDLIARERARQTLSEGYTPDHDDEHDDDSLINAAICYLVADGVSEGHVPYLWPWSTDDWKPSDDRVRNLEKAGALVAAEIDRLLRLDESER